MSLRAMLERQKGEIEQLGNFKQDCSGPIYSVITQLSDKIIYLEKEVAANSKIADLVLNDVRSLI
jgi:hypothetical protein